jgi:aryl-alcohol dehydrogenase-like predicted oxidoreductase
MRYLMIGGATPSPRRVSALALGAMRFGTATEEPTAFAILDRFLAAGGNLVDTANNYAWWHDGGRGGRSESLLGRWRASRCLTEEVVIATKVAAFGALASAGEVALLGVSNHRAWRVERARAIARATGVAGYVQYHRSYLQHRTDLPRPRSAFGDPGLMTADVLDYVSAEPGLVNVAYSPLLAGGYTRPDKTPGEEYAAAGNAARLQTLAAMAREMGATRNQVVLAWLIGDSLPTISLVGASSVDRLQDGLDAVDLDLTAAQRARLDAAR